MQACGDAHVANFGKFATPERNLVFDINDFDETVPGPWEWDVKRLAAACTSSRATGFNRNECDEIVTAAVRAYRERMADAAELSTMDLWYDRTHINDVIAHFPPRTARRGARRQAGARKDHRARDRQADASDGERSASSRTRRSSCT